MQNTDTSSAQKQIAEGDKKSEKPTQYGKRLVTVPLRGMGQRVKLMALPICFIMGILMLGSESDDTMNNVTNLVGGSVLTIGGIVLLIAYVWGFGQRIVLYENGIVYTHFSTSRRYLWKDISALILEDKPATMFPLLLGATYQKYYLALFVDDRKILHFDHNIPYHREVGDTIIEFITPALVSRFMQALKQGQTLTFGKPFGEKIKIGKSGITIGNKLLKWKEISQCSLYEGHLVLSQAGQQKDIFYSIQKVPNGYILNPLINKLLNAYQTKSYVK